MRRFITTLLLSLFFTGLVACSHGVIYIDDSGASQTDRAVNIPFDTMVEGECLYGPGTVSPLRDTTNQYDVDLAIMNTDDLVYAPVAGIAYVQNDDEANDFGTHVNIDLEDGTFVTVSHLAESFLVSGQPVAVGELLGVEGNSGAPGGLRVGIGRHAGDPSQSASASVSVPSFAVNGYGEDDVVQRDVLAMHCSERTGGWYESMLATPRAHPDGTLLAVPDTSLLYLVDHEHLRPFVDQASALAIGYSLQNATRVSGKEIGCYPVGSTMPETGLVAAVRDNEGNDWLVTGTHADCARQRSLIPSTYENDILTSWGMSFETARLPNAREVGIDLKSYPIAGPAAFRDGTLLKERSSPTIYDVVDGMAEPIADPDTFALLGFTGHPIETVADGEVVTVQKAVGNCGAGIGCLKSSNVLVCNGETYTESGDPDEP